MFLGKKTRWEDNTKISFVMLEDQLIYETFLEKYVGKTLAQYRSYWRMQVFNGLGRMPAAFNHAEDVIEYISGTEGAIGFVSSDSIIDEDNIKTITVK